MCYSPPFYFSPKVISSVIIFMLSYLILSIDSAYSQETNTPRAQNLLDLSLKELFNITITSASLFPEDDFSVGSTVTVIRSDYWQQRGARRIDDALSYMPGFTPLPHFLGTKNWVVRGFTNVNGSGVQTLWDGVPINTLPVGSAQLDHPNIQLDTLDSIEVIRGPGSALYGAEAFHGVVSLRAYEAKQDQQQIRLQVATNRYKSGSYRASYALNPTWRLNLAMSANGQPDQNFKYQFIDGSSIVQTRDRDYQYDNYTTTVKLESDQRNKISHKLGFYYNNYQHRNFYYDGSEVPDNDVSNADTYIGMLKGDIKWNYSNHRDLVLTASQWSEGRQHSRILRNGNKITIVVDQETQTSAKLVYRDKKITPDTQLSLAFEHRINSTKNAYRKITQPNQTVVLNSALFFGKKTRNLNSFLLDAKTSYMNKKYNFLYGFRIDIYSDYGDNISPRLGLIRYLNKNSVIKLLYGNAFKAPTGNELYGSPFQVGNLQLNPETIDTLELVYLKKTKNIKLELVFFISKWRDGIRTIDTDSDGFEDQYANIENSSSHGIEASYTRKYHQWKLDINGSYVNSRNDTENLNYVIFPRYIVNLGIGYQFKNGWTTHFNNRVLLDMSRSPDTATIKSEKLTNYWRTDLNITKKLNKKWHGFLNVLNLFNTNNQLPVEFNSTSTTQFIGGIQDQEITVDIGLQYRF